MTRLALAGRSRFVEARDQHNVYVDARMVTNMGIGRHISEHIKGLDHLGVALSISYLDEVGLKEVRRACPAAEIFHSSAKIYGLRERFGGSLGIGSFFEDIDVYWFPQYNVPWILPYPSVVTVHDLIQLRYNRITSGGRFRVMMAEAVMRNALKQAARIVCVSHATEKDIIEMDGSFAKRIRVVENGVGHKWGRPSVSGRREVMNCVGKSPYLLSVSTRKPHKNQVLLLRLLDALRENSNIQLILAGPKTPEWTRVYAKWASKSKAVDRVHDLGKVSEEFLIELYRGASVFLMPSLYEGFGLPVLEAMMAGAPTVVSNRGALPEVVGEAGKILDPLDLDKWVETVQQLLMDRDEAARLIRLGKARAKNFSWRRQSQKLLEVFEEVM